MGPGLRRDDDNAHPRFALPGEGPLNSFFRSFQLSESRGQSQENECCAQLPVFGCGLISLAA